MGWGKEEGELKGVRGKAGGWLSTGGRGGVEEEGEGGSTEGEERNFGRGEYFWQT